MELRHLRYFIAVAEEENVSQAARRLKLSPAALSKQVRELEDELGFPLLSRDVNAVSLTEAGLCFLEEARAVLSRIEAAVRTAQSVATSDKEKVHIGYTSAATVQFFPAALHLFRSEYPDLHIKPHDLPAEEMLLRLRSRKLDLAFMVRPPVAMLRGLRFETLCEDPFCLALGRTHALARLRSIPLQGLVGRPLALLSRVYHPEHYNMLEVLCQGSGAVPQVAAEYEDGVALMKAVEAGDAVTLIPRSFASVTSSRVTLIPIEPPIRSLSLGAACRKERLPDAAALLLRLARSTAQGEAG